MTCYIVSLVTQLFWLRVKTVNEYNKMLSKTTLIIPKTSSFIQHRFCSVKYSNHYLMHLCLMHHCLKVQASRTRYKNSSKTIDKLCQDAKNRKQNRSRQITLTLFTSNLYNSIRTLQA